MTPERMAALVRLWVRLYTRNLPPPVAHRRAAEIGADVHDHIAHDRAEGTSDRRIAAGVVSRMARGMAADAAWRGEQVQANAAHPVNRKAATKRYRRAYRRAAAAMVFSLLFLVWLIGALGLVGQEGDRADLMYLGVLGVAVLGSVVARFRAGGMARVLVAMAVVLALAGVAALVAGKHEDPATSVAELVGLHLMFVVLFLGASALFRAAARRKPAPASRPD